MKTFKTGKIRKNAKNQIKALLEMATFIGFNKYSFDMYSDCYTYDDEIQTSIGFAVKWMAENYSDLSVFLTCNEQGEPKELTISAFGGYFTVTFGAIKRKKPSLTLAKVTEALKAGYVSPLNSDVKHVDLVKEIEPDRKPARKTSLGKFVEMMIVEKGRDTEESISIPGQYGLTYDILIDFIESSDIETQLNIKKTMSRIDFKNGDIFHYLDRLATGMAEKIAIH